MKKIVVFVFVGLIVSSCVIVKPGEVGVRQFLGRLKGSPASPGPTIINPLTTTLVRIPTRTVNKEIKTQMS